MREIPIHTDPLVPPDTMYGINPWAFEWKPVTVPLTLASLDPIISDLAAERVRAWYAEPSTLMRLLMRDPWDRPDRNPFPIIVPFPRLRAMRQRFAAGRRRLADAWGVLLHGLPEPEECDCW
jgi:hypothetical protein